jgi:hypothetical protein
MFRAVFSWKAIAGKLGCGIISIGGIWGSWQMTDDIHCACVAEREKSKEDQN